MYPESRQNQCFYEHVHDFLGVAEDDRKRKGDPKICCPCVRCKNETMYDYESGQLFRHLLQYGFMEGYTRWTSHGEEAAVADDDDGHAEAESDLMGHEEPGGDMEETVADMVNDPHLRKQIEKENVVCRNTDTRGFDTSF